MPISSNERGKGYSHRLGKRQPGAAEFLIL